VNLAIGKQLLAASKAHAEYAEMSLC